MTGPSNHDNTGHHESQPDFCANLDILRALAVLLVLGSHMVSVANKQHHLESWGDYGLSGGRLGVLIFFVHTSLVLNFSLARLATSISGWELFRTFMVRRIFRLYPLNILCVLLVVAFSIPGEPWAPNAVNPDWVTVLSNMTLTSDFFDRPVVLSPMWTLPIEMQMYVLMPFIFILLGTARNTRIALGAWLIAAVVGWMQPSLVKWLSVILCGPCFLAGTVAYTLSGRYTQKLASLLWMPFLLSMVYMFYLVQQGAPEGVGNAPLQWALCLIIGFAIPAFHDSRAVVVNYVANRIARYSYGIYLFHMIALWIGCTVLRNQPELVQWAVFLAVLAVLSIGTYHLLEKPAIDLGVRLTSVSPRKAPLLSTPG